MSKAEKSSSSSQPWATFVKNHVRDIWACDFTVANDWLFRTWYIFMVMEFKTRRIVHTTAAPSPTNEWTAQQLCEATPWGESPKYLLHDRDSEYGVHFSAVAASSHINELRTPYLAPRDNSIRERFMGSLRRECFGHTLILHGRQLRRVINEYIAYFNQERPHQVIGQRIPDHYDQSKANPTGGIISKAFLGGLHCSYSRTTHLN